ncbi:hypothetical protein QYF61_023358 [Mycteria americana]|uniref:Uncharacterized protein n=1 Tax=Mycteria americana TaxID=33587 RepID=A0AAN7RWF7_MYCAM|nr:hypothetical protein QYF61_023358 [Mycteria americana]
MSQSATSTRLLNTSRDGDSTTSLGSLFQCLTTLSVKKFFPNIHSKPLLTQLEAISSHPIASYLGEETDPHLTTTSFQVVVESNKVSPQPPFLQAKQSQFPQPLLIRLALQTLHQLRCPSLDTLQQLNVLLVVRGPKVNTVFEGHNHFPTPAGHTVPDRSQDAVGFLGHLGTLLAHIQPAVNQVLFRLAAFQPLFPKPVALHGVAVAQVQDLALGLVQEGMSCVTLSSGKAQARPASQMQEFRQKLAKGTGKKRETQITATCWGLAHAYRALLNTVQNPQGEEKVSGSDSKATGTVATPAPPATGTVATPTSATDTAVTPTPCDRHCG